MSILGTLRGLLLQTPHKTLVGRGIDSVRLGLEGEVPLVDWWYMLCTAAPSQVLQGQLRVAQPHGPLEGTHAAVGLIRDVASLFLE